MKKFPSIPREEYMQRSVERAWPSGEWIQVPAAEGEGVQPLDRVLPEGPPPPGSLTVIGTTKDEKLISEQLAGVDRVILGRLPSGRGAESKIAAKAEELGLQVWEVEPLYGLQSSVEAVLSTDIQSPVLLIGNGQRVKQARSWLARARWGREVIEC